MTSPFVRGRSIRLALSLGIAAAGLLSLAACADSGGRDAADAAYDRQDQLLRNPMADPTMSDPDITGGGFGDYHDQSMQRDLNNAFN